MTDQPTNPLVAGKSGTGRKLTIEDLHSIAAEASAVAARHGAPWSFAVVPNDDGKMCVRRVIDHRAPHRRSVRNLLDRRGEPMATWETAQLNAMLENLGATARYREDGSKYHIERAKAA